MATTEGSKKAASHPGDQHQIPEFQPHSSALDTLKARIAQHYDLASTYYYSLWGEHIHHGLFTNGCTTKEAAQANLIDFMLNLSGFPPTGADVLDVGCGLGGTSRYLAQHRAATVTGITISSQQVELARKITIQGAAAATTPTPDPTLTATAEDSEKPSTNPPAITAPVGEDPDSASLAATPYHAFGPSGHVRFLHLDAEQMHNHLTPGSYSHVWITEALSHIPNKALFFKSAFELLAPSTAAKPSRLVVADWFRGPAGSFEVDLMKKSNDDKINADQDGDDGLTPTQLSTIAQIEDGMLLPTLPRISSYISLARAAGFVLSPVPSSSASSSQSQPSIPNANPIDISTEVAATWDISWSLISSPSLWAYAISQGRDGLSFLQSFRAMRSGYSSGALRYGVLVLEKPC